MSFCLLAISLFFVAMALFRRCVASLGPLPPRNRRLWIAVPAFTRTEDRDSMGHASSRYFSIFRRWCSTAHAVPVAMFGADPFGIDGLCGARASAFTSAGRLPDLCPRRVRRSRATLESRPFGRARVELRGLGSGEEALEGSPTGGASRSVAANQLVAFSATRHRGIAAAAAGSCGDSPICNRL
jgi:hypothetical protein